MDSKKKVCNTLRLFYQEFGVPEWLTFNSFKEQTGKGTMFMKQIRQHDIDYHASEPDLHNQNFIEDTIHKLQQKWYRNMIKKRVLREFLDYGMR